MTFFPQFPRNDNAGDCSQGHADIGVSGLFAIVAIRIEDGLGLQPSEGFRGCEKRGSFG